MVLWLFSLNITCVALIKSPRYYNTIEIIFSYFTFMIIMAGLRTGLCSVLVCILSFTTIETEFVEQLSHKVTFTRRTLVEEYDDHVTLRQSDYRGGSVLHNWNTRDIIETDNGISFREGLDRRIRRQLGTESGLTLEQIQESLDIHNALRRTENASNMEFLVSKPLGLIVIFSSRIRVGFFFIYGTFERYIFCCSRF